MAAIEKLSVSLPADQVRWAKKLARANNTSFSGLLSRLIEEKRQHAEALEAMSEYFGNTGAVTPEEAMKIRATWEG